MSERGRSAGSLGRSNSLVPGLGLVLLAGALLAWSFRKWTDPVIDFGLELYLPWRLLEGEVLYRDLAYRNGPLSPYWNAALFAVGGVSLRTLVIANLAVLAAIVAGLHRMLCTRFGRLGAFAGCAVLLVVHGFSQYGSVGNYNFVTPYQHGQTHGLLLALAVVALLGRALRGPGAPQRWWAGAGLALGLLSLTKAEIFAPALACAVFAVGATARCAGRAQAGRAAGWLLGTAALAPLAAFAALALAMPAALAARGVAGNWLYLATASSDPFYQRAAGLDAPLANVARMAVAGLFVAALFGLRALAGRAGWRARTRPADGAARAAQTARGARSVPPPALCAALAAGLLGAALSEAPLRWADAARALPLVVGAAALRSSVLAWRSADARQAGHALLPLFALLLLGKLGLRPQVQHYGFALAAPATAWTVAALLGTWRMQRTPRLPLGPLAARALAGAAVLAFALALWRDADAILARKTFELRAPRGADADAILCTAPQWSPRGAVLETVLRGLDATMRPEDTLLVMPEGASLNYWLRRRNPTPYALFLPTELAAHGGAEAMLDRMRRTPPDFVALVHRGHAEFGTGPFLRDPRNGAAFAQWLRSEYRPLTTVGAEPFRGPAFGVRILRRAAPTD